MPKPGVLASLPISKKLLLLLVFVFLCAGAVITWLGIQQGAKVIEEAKRNTVLLAESVSAQQEQATSGTKFLLATMANFTAAHKLDAVACNRVLREEIKNQRPFYSIIGVATLDGNVFAGSTSSESGAVNISDRKYFRDAVRTLDFSGGEFQVGRLSKVPSINFAYPVLDSDNKLVAILYAGFKLAEYANFIPRMSLPEGSVVTISDHKGMRLFRSPETGDSTPGLPVADDLFLDMSGESESDGGVFEKSGEDKVSRIYAFKKLRLKENTPPYLYISVGIPKDPIVHKARLGMLNNLTILWIVGISMSLIWILGNLMITKPVKHLVMAAQRIGEGQMGARTDLSHTSDEFGQLAKSFDNMASLLEARNIEQQMVEEALRESESKYRNLIETTGIGYVIVDLEGRVLDANLQYARLTGYSSIQQILGRSLFEWTAPYDLERNAEGIKKCVVDGAVRNLEIDYLDSEGQVIAVEINATLTSTTDGRVIICLIKDIKERRKAEAELRDVYDGLETKVTERTAELAAINEYLENIFENSPDIIVIVDEHGKFIRWNRGAAEQLGYSFEEMRGKSAFELYTDKKQLDGMLTDLRRRGAVKNYVIDMVKKDGDPTTFEMSITLLKNSAGRVIGSVAVARDLSPLKRANDVLQKEVERRMSIEESLRQSEAVYRESEKKYRCLYQEFQALLDAIPDILVLLSPDLKPVWANRAYAARVEMEKLPSSLIGRRCYQDLHDREEPCDGCPAPVSLNSGEPAVAVIATARGELFEVRSVPIKDENGKITKLINVARDITETRKAEEQLQRAYAEMAQVLASIPSFLIGLTADLKIMRWNCAAEKTFGIGSSTALDKPFHQCWIYWDRQKISEAISFCQKENQAVRLHNCHFVQTDGKEGFLDVTVSPVDGSGNKPPGILLLGSDVTERKILESQLVQAQKLESIGQLAAGIAHEINTPAQYVGDNARFLQEACGDLERVHDLYDQLIEHLSSEDLAKDLVQKIEAAAAEIDLKYIRQEAPKAIMQSLDGIDRISRIVRAMKEFSHPGTAVKTDIDLNKSIENTITVARNEWKYVAEMVTDFDPGLPLVPCLPAEINQVILNMIINASQAVAAVPKQDGSVQKGTITITTRARENYAEISIGDTGIGIPEDIRSRVFDPFFTTKEVGKGTGQGLAISHSVVVDKHGGSITFDSEVGKGTVFVVKLPLQNGSEE